MDSDRSGLDNIALVFKGIEGERFEVCFANKSRWDI